MPGRGALPGAAPRNASAAPGPRPDRPGFPERSWSRPATRSGGNRCGGFRSRASGPRTAPGAPCPPAAGTSSLPARAGVQSLVLMGVDRADRRGEHPARVIEAAFELRRLAQSQAEFRAEFERQLAGMLAVELTQ